MRNLARSMAVSALAASMAVLVSAPASAASFTLRIDAPNGAYGAAQWFDGSETLCLSAGGGSINGDYAKVTISPRDGKGPRYSLKVFRGHGRACRQAPAVPENERYRMKLVAFNADRDKWATKRVNFTA